MKRALLKVRELIFPMATYCICCGKFIDSGREYCLCDHCIRHIEWGHISIDIEEKAKTTGCRAYLDSALACAYYGLYTGRLIFELKYDGHTYVARVLGKIMADRLFSDESAHELLKADYIIPVPIHKSKLKERGFNQAEKMGKYLAKEIKEVYKDSHGPMLFGDALRRNRQTAAQRSVSGLERFSNLKDAFQLSPGAQDRLKGKTVILVDDVYTTGATANICAGVLKEAGAKKVHLLALATGNVFARGFFKQTGKDG